ncbi:PREDICTED: caprin homolog isoform X1 [Drosophila arizonae]|uniref:Caprin homolog isoform X1 n=1 Tax=Drosophila arizonae TaxID=7263 RepID=A0ABM1P841_DROAR|nr:PREDICTED: caprin homolog isoform X1 [Drosophila arizonae]
MPSAATTFTNTNNNSKEKRASVSSIGASSVVGGGVGGGGCNNGNASNGQHSSNTNLADSAKSVAATGVAPGSGSSQTDLTNNNTNVNAKALKLSAVAANAATEPYNPMKQILVTIEHKIRNLEKRKTKLESYRAIQAGGKELSADQGAAVAKYDSVLATLEFARDFSKQTQQMFKEAEKEQKKQARKDNQAKSLAEIAKIRELLVMQNVLSCFNDEQVRNDFVAGENGACKLEIADLEVIEKFCMDVQTRRPEIAEDVSFLATAQKAAELFAMTINARAKPYGDTTFEKLRALFQQIQDCGYLDKYYLIPLADQSVQGNCTDSGTVSGEGETMLNDVAGIAGDHDVPMSEPSAHNSLEEGLDKLTTSEAGTVLPDLQQPERGHLLLEPQHQRAPVVDPQQQQQQLLVQQQQQPGVYNAASATAAAPASNTTPVHIMYASAATQATHVPPPGQHPHQLLSSPVNLQALHGVPQSQPPQAGVAAAPSVPTQQQQQQQQHFGPTTVRAVEHNYFKQPPLQPPQAAAALQAPTPQQQQQFMQQLRPLAEVLGTGSFHFLQDSELDAPDVLPPQQQHSSSRHRHHNSCRCKA